MKFAAYLRRDPLVDRDALPEAAAPRLERELSGGADLAKLIKLGPEVVGALNAGGLVGVVESYERYKEWRARAVQVARRLESIEREVVARTTTAQQLAAIERGLKLCEAGRVEAMNRAGVLATCLELWDACRGEVRTKGTVRCTPADPEHPSLGQYDDYVERTMELDGLQAHQWLAIRRGEREGALQIDVKHEGVELLEQVVVRRERLGKAAYDRTDESLLQEVVVDDIVTAVLGELDEWARGQALRSAAAAYTSLLVSRPLRVDRLASVHLGSTSQPVGAALVDGDGVVLDWVELDTAEEEWLERAADLVLEHNVRHIAVPSDTASSKRLAAIQDRLGQGYIPVPTRPAALKEGRATLTGADKELPRSVRNAVVLARRAMFPTREWAAIDPVRAGVGEYQSQLDQQELRNVLEAAREQARRQVKRSPPPPQVTGPGVALGAEVNSVSELRPGMILAGSITNLTGFGAFVSLGLEYEGMIHVSELSDDFVSDPAQVVQIGQKVSARVLDVDPRRRRISLSLRSPNEGRGRSGGRGGGDRDRGGRGGGRGGGSGPHRSQAFRELDNLFKK